MPGAQEVNVVSKSQSPSQTDKPVTQLTKVLRYAARWSGLAVVALLPGTSNAQSAPGLADSACCNGTIVDAWRDCKTANGVACLWGFAAVGVLAVMAVVAIGVSAVISCERRARGARHSLLEDDSQSMVSHTSFGSTDTTRTTVTAADTVDGDERTRPGAIDLPFKRLNTAMDAATRNAQELRQEYATVITVHAPPIELPKQITPKSSPVAERHNPPAVVIGRPRPNTERHPLGQIEAQKVITSLRKHDEPLANSLQWLAKPY